MVCQAGVVDVTESKAISVMLGETAMSSVGFSVYDLDATPIMAQKRKFDWAW